MENSEADTWEKIQLYEVYAIIRDIQTVLLHSYKKDQYQKWKLWCINSILYSNESMCEILVTFCMKVYMIYNAVAFLR